ncbi:MAG: PKD domain-containing protein [Rhodothermales bacterium]|nr:PKD domain-containing protein [Rhodothermales bacterium]
MSHRLLKIFPLAALLLVTAVGTTEAQNLRPEDTFFIKPRVGISSYLGDNEKSPANFNFDMYKIDGKLPYNVAIELGYQFSVPFSLSLAYQLGNYPIITQFPERGEATGSEDNINDDPTIRNSVQLFGRYTFADATSTVAPYINFGGVLSFGDVLQKDRTQNNGVAFGPLLGLGLDFALNDRTSFFLEAQSGAHVPDEEIDGNEGNGFGSLDLLTGIGLGLKINFKRAFTPVEIVGLNCPAQLVVGSSGNFSATTNDDIASQPVEYRWDFGDGSTGTGLSGSHSFAQGGTYTVTFTATNSGSTDTRSCTVRVVAPAEIVTVTSNKTTVSICDPDPSITFSANVRGDQPLTYRWDFGDGTTATGASASHTYANVGTYTVTLTVSNDAGQDSRTLRVTVTDENCFNCDISSMNAVFFDRNSSVLTPQARQALAENLEILENCPNICVEIVGYASRDERNPQRLSEDRARAVEQFYIDNGVAASRLMSRGAGATGQTTKKGGATQFRRVDSIPVDCDDLGTMDDDM